MTYKVKPNLNLSLYFDNDYFITGDLLNGTLELNVENELNLRLREICVELNGFEEINFQKVNASKVFFSTKIYFQGPKIKPSPAVRGPAEYDGFWNAVQGKTLFNFSFKLPHNAPNSFSLMNNNANVKYIVTGTVQYHQDNIYDSLYTSEEVLVLENIDQESMPSVPVRAFTKKKMLLGNSVRLEGIALQSYFCSGKKAQIEVHVENDTKHKIHGLKANLYRSVIIPGTVTKKDNKSIINSISEINLKSNEYVFNSNEEKSVFIHIPIPENNISMKNTSLFIVQYYITLSLNQGMFSKNVSVNLPISICHSKLYNSINNPIKKSNTNKNMFLTVPKHALAPKKTFLNNLRSLSRKASLLKNKALLSKLCISDSDDYSKDYSKRKGSSRLSEVSFPSNYDRIKRQNDMHLKNVNNNLEKVDSYYDRNRNNNDYSNSYSLDTTTTEFNTISNMNIGISETERDTSYEDSNNNSNSYIQNESINIYNRDGDDMDLDENISDSEVTGTENTYSSDIDKFSKYFSNNKVFRSLSIDNRSSNNRDNNNNNNNNNNINRCNKNGNKSDNKGNFNVYNNSKMNNSITYSNSYNYGKNYRSKTFDTSSIKSKESSKSTQNMSFGEIRSSNIYRNNKLNNKNIPIKPKISSSNLKKVTSIESMNDDDDADELADHLSNITHDTTFLRNLSYPYAQPNESSYNKSFQSTSSKMISSLSKNYSFNSSHDKINETFDAIFNESAEIGEPIKNQNSILSSIYSNKTLNRNNSFHSNSSFSNRKRELESSSISSLNSQFARYNNNTDNINNISLPASSSPSFSKIHINGNINHSYNSSSPMTPTIKHNFSNKSMKSAHSVDGYLYKNNNHQLNANKNLYRSNTVNNNNSSFMKQMNSSPSAVIPIKSKSKIENYGFDNQNYYRSSSYSTPPLLNPSSPYTIPTLSNYINQFQRRPSLKYH
ncbi:hypothetical protein H8356DRAFT_1031898 [Neocallimastix lanati (nom. inval.)]|nr:hypothetical protein H8356DRAFT_1031898 [Neocallimastix sp. JGI-2020a]